MSLHNLAHVLERTGDLVGAGRMFLDIGRFHEALPLLSLHLSEGLQNTPEDARDRRIQAAAWLVQLYETMSEPDDAEHWRSAV